MPNTRALPRTAAFALPLIALIGLAVSRSVLDPAVFDRWVLSELGVVELGTVVLLIPAIVFGVLCMRLRDRHAHLLHTAWLGALTLACVYFAGEELSWGQHLFGWQTPESIEALNDQQETNLHNMSSWLDQKPRLLLELWVLIGGVLIGTWRLLRSRGPDWFWPGGGVALTAWAAILVRLPERLDDWTDWTLTPWWSFRLSEVQEAFFGMFLLLYLWSAWLRLRTECRTPQE